MRVKCQGLYVVWPLGTRHTTGEGVGPCPSSAFLHRALRQVGSKLPFQNCSQPLQLDTKVLSVDTSVTGGPGHPQIFGLWFSQAHPTHPGCGLIWKRAKDEKLTSSSLCSRPSTCCPNSFSEVMSCHSGPGPQTPWHCPPIVLSP